MDPSRPFSPQTTSAESTKPLRPPMIKRPNAPAENFSGSDGPEVRGRGQPPADFRVPMPDKKDTTLQKVRFGDTNVEQPTKQQKSTLTWQQPLNQNNHANERANRVVTAQDSNSSVSSGSHGNGDFHKMSKFEAFKSSTDKLFHSDKEENKKLKAVFGAVAGLVIGGLLFVVLVYSFGYTTLEAAIIVTISTVIMCMCLALSSLCRCIMALVFPNFFTGKGRAVFLSIIFGVLLSNQISNITHNAKETGNSLACITELAANQTRALQRQLAQPIKDVTKYVQTQQEHLRQIGKGIRGSFQQVNETLGEADKGVESAKAALGGVAQKCRQEMGSICSACSSLDIFPGIGLGGECKDACNEITKLCNPLDQFNSIVTEATGKIRSDLNEALQYFEVDLEVNSEISGSTNTSKEVPAIQEEVNRDIEAKAEAFQGFLIFCKKFLSFSLALIFFQAFWYLRNYLAKDGYDNVYITKQFRQLDKESVARGGEAILPLKTKEASVYVNTSAWTLNSSELAYCKLGLLQVFLHFLLCLLVVVFDVTLYYILNVVQKYGDIDINVEGQGQFQVNVKGKGPVADFYKMVVQGVNIGQNFSMSLAIGDCLPHPTTPSFGILPVLLVLYIIALCFVVLRGYGMRLRRKISAYYYPEQEYARLEYLHKKIRHKRVGFLKFLRQQIKSSHKENAVKDKLRLSTWLMFRFPILAACIPSRDKVECTSCEQVESSFHGIHMTKCSGTKGGVACEAMYCPDCLTALSNGCPLCSFDEVELRD